MGIFFDFFGIICYIRKKEVCNMVERKEYLNQLWAWKDEQIIKVVTGIRRCGKSVLLEQYQNKLLSTGIDPEQIISINFEDWIMNPYWTIRCFINTSNNIYVLIK